VNWDLNQPQCGRLYSFVPQQANGTRALFGARLAPRSA
jgi:hypothetical protein